MERRFVIRECNEKETYGQITESELLRRLSLCVTSKDRIATLLYGEKIKKDKTPKVRDLRTFR